MKPKFASNQEALNHYLKEVSEIEESTSRSFEDLCAEAEHSLSWNDLLSRVHSLNMIINTLKYYQNRYE